MNNRLILIIAVFFSTCSLAHGASPVYSEFTVDTSIYEYVLCDNLFFIPDPYFDGTEKFSHQTNDMLVIALLQKNSNQLDLYSCGGKCGSVTIPDIRNCLSTWLCSQTFIDDDPDWETLTYTSELNGSERIWQFKVLDSDGTTILSDSGRASYGFDGQNTYVVSESPYKIRSWRFRTNIAAAGPALKKTTASTTMPMTIYGPTNDNLRIKLIPTGSDRTTVQLFDLMGRCLFSKEVGKLTSPVTFTVPEGNIPQSPFITRVENDDGEFVKKRLPVK